ncbi:Vitamin B12 transporter BtuB [Asticcacaulis sp. MM231]|uniref:TonB-dependent receptor n=1 Tax=Asticcacaulis sp. MM231 TaxID=3157666 RepID=UPI0032D59BAF
MKLTKTIILAGTALTALSGLFAGTVALAQSTATEEVEVIVKGGKKGLGPINKETGTKTKTAIDQAYISTQTAGQTIAETLNLAPGYNFTNNDPYGSSGGNVRLRGLDGSRVSLTMDGVQLNDAGNYAVYTNQQLDPELIQSATITTGATDVNSMTASASGGTISYTTRKTSDTFGAEATLSVGSFNYTRQFVMVNTGSFGPFGTQAWFAVSNQNYDTFTVEKPNNAKLKKQQFNFNIYQPLSNGSYFGLRGDYNENRNRLIFSQNLASFAANGKYYNSAGAANINPSNTGNLRGYSKWIINDNFFFTVDPTFQSVLANGGGTGTIAEKDGKMTVSSRTYFYKELAGVDINKDGDATDSVSVYNPNTTSTNRYSVTSTGVYTFNRGDVVRFGASFDRGRTRQTGESTLLNTGGTAFDPFGGRDIESLRIIGKDGSTHERRQRFSLANVDTFFLEYRGHFLEDKLFVSLGVKQQKMERDLNQYCYSPDDGSGSYAPFCTTTAPTVDNGDGTVSFGYTYLITTNADGVTKTNHTNFIKPFHTTVSFSKTLPSLGATYKLTDHNQVYVNYSEALSAPRTDNYYGVIFKDGEVKAANPLPESNKTIELGYRFTSPTFTATADVWAQKYEDRIVSSYDADSDSYFDRNVGAVDLKGFEASAAYAPSSKLSLFGGLTYTDTEILDNYASGATTTIDTKGKALPEVPDWMATAGLTYKAFEDFTFNLNGKYVGKRYATDLNDLEVKAYTVWNGSVRWDLPGVSFLKAGTYAQLNVINITDEYYFGSISSTTNAVATATLKASAPSFNVGAPRTVMMSLHTAF